jgi:hydroxymethylglutaryl-CoA lyase
MSSAVKIVEVGPRDGLQNEKTRVSTPIKVELINRLTAAGVTHIEAASFVSPKWVPQLADGAEVMQQIEHRSGVIYAALVPNMKGVEAALAANIDEVVIFTSASEAFCQRNINCSIAESFARFVPVAQAAKDHEVRLRGSVSCALGCPYQGEVPVADVAGVVRRLRELGCNTIDIADTIGIGTANRVKEVVRTAATEFPIHFLAGHYHDTYGQALANVLASLEAGLTIFHSSVGGLGGCPFAEGATGNLASEDLLYLLHGLGCDTGIDLDEVARIGDFISQAIGRQNSSRAGRALLIRAKTGAKR